MECMERRASSGARSSPISSMLLHVIHALHSMRAVKPYSKLLGYRLKQMLSRHDQHFRHSRRRSGRVLAAAAIAVIHQNDDLLAVVGRTSLRSGQNRQERTSFRQGMQLLQKETVLDDIETETTERAQARTASDQDTERKDDHVNIVRSSASHSGQARPETLVVRNDGTTSYREHQGSDADDDDDDSASSSDDSASDSDTPSEDGLAASQDDAASTSDDTTTKENTESAGLLDKDAMMSFGVGYALTLVFFFVMKKLSPPDEVNELTAEDIEGEAAPKVAGAAKAGGGPKAAAAAKTVATAKAAGAPGGTGPANVGAAEGRKPVVPVGANKAGTASAEPAAPIAGKAEGKASSSLGSLRERKVNGAADAENDARAARQAADAPEADDHDEDNAGGGEAASGVRESAAGGSQQPQGSMVGTGEDTHD
ncbi:unnamed protein product [Amoebophrya sp. A25]|nr:unnamed protein product [Amoebophrya sp. A25]|eukprot:GSA25T00026476001.1